MNDDFRPYTVVNAARASSLTATQRSVLIACAFRADGSGEFYASQDLLAEDTALAARTVRRDLAALVALGVLAEDARPGRTTRYRIVVQAIPRHHVPQPRHHVPGSTPAPRAATPAPRAATPAPRAADPISDPISDPNHHPLAPASGGTDPGTDWVSDYVLEGLAELAHEGRDMVELVAQLDRPSANHVDRLWAEYSTRAGGWSRAPAGLRQRQIAAGIRLAAHRWRRRSLDPPGNFPEFPPHQSHTSP